MPINTAKDLMTRFQETEVVKRPWLGISGAALTPTLAEYLEIDVTEGVYVSSVALGSPAEEAGLIAGGDVIKAVDGVDVTSVDQIVEHFNALDPGDSVTLTLYRDGETLEVDVTLGEWPYGA